MMNDPDDVQTYDDVSCLECEWSGHGVIETRVPEIAEDNNLGQD